jgi:hypothetical protein
MQHFPHYHEWFLKINAAVARAIRFPSIYQNAREWFFILGTLTLATITVMMRPSFSRWEYFLPFSTAAYEIMSRVLIILHPRSCEACEQVQPIRQKLLFPLLLGKIALIK